MYAECKTRDSLSALIIIRQSRKTASSPGLIIARKPTKKKRIFPQMCGGAAAPMKSSKSNIAIATWKRKVKQDHAQAARRRALHSGPRTADGGLHVSPPSLSSLPPPSMFHTENRSRIFHSGEGPRGHRSYYHWNRRNIGKLLRRNLFRCFPCFLERNGSSAKRRSAKSLMYRTSS